MLCLLSLVWPLLLVEKEEMQTTKSLEKGRKYGFLGCFMSPYSTEAREIVFSVDDEIAQI